MGFNVEELINTLGIFYYVIVYGIGLLAMTLSVIAFQFKRRVTIILSNFFGQTSWVFYFLLQGDLTSAIACALSAVMLAVFAKKDKWKWATHPVVIIFFILLLSGFSMLSFKGWSDIFPLLAGVFAVIANSRTMEKRLRQFSFFWCIFWLMNSTFKMYPVAFANDLLCTISTIVALIRYRDGAKIKESKNEKV